ncbi:MULTISPECIES: hypothetical protein [unclassified Streptomyces]|uniref:hypothetical protein n=1 Tax=unclassified Streptomyces TaxID=2593676 RepID=UPI00044C026A|nr:hypothetical protein [Streptomyces sp. PCS3-D2]WKV75370.1 hypothetical protein AW27_029910 [Streptomyces sp. PCS3-D2]
MSHVLTALGVAVLCVSGSVWYVPAITDIRAGADRPVSRRLAATACLTGWGTAAFVTLLLLAAAPRGLVALAAVAGTAASCALAVQGRVQHGAEQREEAGRWSALGHPPPARTGALPRRAVTAWAVAGFTLIPGTAVATFLARW